MSNNPRRGRPTCTHTHAVHITYTRLDRVCICVEVLCDRYTTLIGYLGGSLRRERNNNNNLCSRDPSEGKTKLLFVFPMVLKDIARPSRKRLFQCPFWRICACARPAHLVCNNNMCVRYRVVERARNFPFFFFSLATLFEMLA